MNQDRGETGSLLDEHFGFLAALLIHFPRIATVRAEGEDLVVTFMLREAPDPAQVETFADRLDRSLAALSRLVGDGRLRTADVSTLSYGELWCVRVARRMQEVVAEEFPILHRMVDDTFGEAVIAEASQLDEATFGTEAFYEPDADEPIALDAVLRRFQDAPVSGRLFGFRDGARVLVFNRS